MRAVSAAAGLGILLAGCVGPSAAPTDLVVGTAGLLEPVFDKLLLENDKLAVLDGVVLDSWVVRPDVAPQTKVPVLILASPYNQGLSERASRLPENEFVKHFASRGYAVVYHSVRGTGDSGGCFNLGGKVEQQDLYEVVEHFGTADWSNGAVALFGVSYVGTTPWEAAILNPPHLRTIIPVSGISDMYRYMYFEGAGYSLAGSRGGGGPTFPSYYYPSVDWGLPVFGGGVSREVPAHAAEAVCPDVVEAVSKGYATGVDGAHDAFWQERDYSTKLASMNASVFLVHGLQDWNVKPDNFGAAWDKVPTAKKMWLGQWAHNIPWRNTFNKEWSRADWNDTMQRWLDHELVGVANGALLDPAVETQDTSGTWRQEATWPPPGTLEVALYPTADGGLAATPPESGSASWIGLPGSSPSAGVVAQSHVAFVSEELPTDLRVAGTPVAYLTLARDRPGDGHVVVSLFDVGPDGSWKEIDRGFLNLRQWKSRDSSSPPPVGEAFAATVPLYPQDLWIQAGHRLGVAFAGEHKDFILPAPNALSYTATLGGGADATRIVLPVVPPEDGGLASVAPAPAPSGGGPVLLAR